MAYKEDVKTGRIALVSAASVIVTVAIVLFLQVLFYGFRQRQLESPQYSQLPAKMSTYVADEQGKLASIRVIDRDRQVATIPIDAAMGLVLTELNANPEANVTGPPLPEVPSDESSPDASGDTPQSDASDAEAATTDDSPAKVAEDTAATDEADALESLEPGEGEGETAPNDSSAESDSNDSAADEEDTTDDQE